MKTKLVWKFDEKAIGINDYTEFFYVNDKRLSDLSRKELEYTIVQLYYDITQNPEIQELENLNITPNT